MKRIALLFAGLLAAAAVVLWMTVIQERPIPADTIDSTEYKSPRYALKEFDDIRETYLSLLQ
jgi:hypothetical protein